MVKQIPLTQGKFAIVDDADYEHLMQWKWCFHKYAMRTEHLGMFNGKKKQKWIGMHSFIMDTPNGMQTDHINGNKLDNRRANLRMCSSAENKRNRPKYSNGLSKFKGVMRIKNSDKWKASICVNSKPFYLGLFKNEYDAAQAYNFAAYEFYGEFANFNREIAA